MHGKAATIKFKTWIQTLEELHTEQWTFEGLNFCLASFLYCVHKRLSVFRYQAKELI